MLSLLLFPLFIFFILNLIFIRSFSRSTGLKVIPLKVTVYFFAGAGLTLLVYVILLALEGILGGWYDVGKNVLSPIVEDSLKILLLSVLTSRVFVASEQLQLYRQRLLAGILLGLAFGLVETYLYSLVRIEILLNDNLLLGSIPFQMVIGGGIGIILSSKKAFLPTKVSFALIMLGHIFYNQSLNLPRPLPHISLLLLFLASLMLLKQLNSPRDPSQDS